MANNGKIVRNEWEIFRSTDAVSKLPVAVDDRYPVVIRVPWEANDGERVVFETSKRPNRLNGSNIRCETSSDKFEFFAEYFSFRAWFSPGQAELRAID
jgi:hypothetical protein